MDKKPLAEVMRPKKLPDVVGQQQLVTKGKILREIVDKKQLISLILWGPPGSGKTTLARIIAHETGAEFTELSAVASGKADITKVVEVARGNKRLGGETVLFVDEIHRFNKAQQDALLPYVEDGTIYLVGATTENPSFEVIKPLLSRSRVVVLEPLGRADIIKLINRAAKRLGITRLDSKVAGLLAELSGGDARVALNNLELAAEIAGKNKISPEIIRTASQKKIPGYDKGGEDHYNLISAFIKSLRGSDTNAALYYLVRILEGGEDPKYVARRMIVFASEDIGVAASSALELAVATFQAVERIGEPECHYNLFHCALYLSKCKKSRAVADAMAKSKEAAKRHPDAAVPLQLRNAPTELMRDLGYQDGYRWQAGFKPGKGFLPDELKDFKVFPE